MPRAITVEVGGLQVGGQEDLHGKYLTDLKLGRKEPFMARLFERAIRPADTVVDGGAYIGYYTLLAARKAKRGRVFAFEPHPDGFAALRKNVVVNGFADSVTLARQALAASGGDMPFYLAAGDASQSSLVSPANVAGQATATAAALDVELRGKTIDVIKLDLEGGEVDALAGACDTLGRNPEVRLFIECNPRSLERAGRTVKELIDQLQELRFRIEAIDELEGRLRGSEDIGMLTQAQDREDHVNLYCSK
jgi:FkbM family methyltransferase